MNMTTKHKKTGKERDAEKNERYCKKVCFGINNESGLPVRCPEIPQTAFPFYTVHGTGFS